MRTIHKKRARLILALVAVLWVGTVWGLSTGRFSSGSPATAQTCHTIPDIPVGQCPKPASSASSGSPRPSGSATPSATRTPTPTQTSPRPTSSSSPSPSPTQTTPPPPSVRRVDSDISIAYADRKNAFTGKVSSNNNRCKSGRRVTVKRVKPGKDATVGKDRTNRRGKWSVGERNPDGRYYAKAGKKSFAGRNNTTIVCKGARSRTIRA